MERLNLTKITQANKKVLIRKEIEADRLGEEIYSDDLLSPYSVYLVRKFEEEKDYEEQNQFDELLTNLIEDFEENFQQFVIKNIYVRTTQKAVYITLLLALAQPLTKVEMNDLRVWMSNLEVSELPEILEHLPANSQEVPLEMVKGLQETTSEVLLLTEMMNQFSLNLTDIYQELQVVKKKKTPPVVKVVKSDAARKKSLESENATLIKTTTEKLDKLVMEFSSFKNQVNQRLVTLSKPKTPPKFKVFFDGEKNNKPSLEERLEEALNKITVLTKEVNYSERKIIELGVAIANNKPKKVPKIKLAAKKETPKSKSILEEKLELTTAEVTVLTKQLQDISQKLSTVETNVLEAKPDSEALARIEKDRGQLKETTSETMKLNEVIDGLNKKLQTFETELTTVKRTKTPPVIKLKKSETVNHLVKQHETDQERLITNTNEINKLTQTVGKVDVELIKAHQKIAELEHLVQLSKKPVVAEPVARQSVPEARELRPKEQLETAPPAKTIVGPLAPPVFKQESEVGPRQEPSGEKGNREPIPDTQAIGNPNQSAVQTSDFPSKEDFLRASRPLSAQVRMQAEVQAQVQNQARAQTMQPSKVYPVKKERVPVTLALEEVLDRVSDQPQTTPSDEKKENYSSHADVIKAKAELPSLRRLKKLEWEIHSFFEKTRGMGHKGMVSKADFNENMQKLEALPNLWNQIYELDRKDLMLGTDLSCQQLIADLTDFIEEATHLSKKRKVMGKWIYCPKEVEQKLEGYKRLGEYFDMYLARKEGVEQSRWDY